MSKNEDRVNEINLAINLITNICENTNIALIAHKMKDGQLAVIIEDNLENKYYGLALNK